MLFSDPGSALPDVFISTSVRHVTEGDSFAYTVVLTHTPGMREDETVDMLNAARASPPVTLEFRCSVEKEGKLRKAPRRRLTSSSISGPNSGGHSVVSISGESGERVRPSSSSELPND